MNRYYPQVPDATDVTAEDTKLLEECSSQAGGLIFLILLAVAVDAGGEYT